jgi:hypothetical protein
VELKVPVVSFLPDFSIVLWYCLICSWPDYALNIYYWTFRNWTRQQGLSTPLEKYGDLEREDNFGLW